jgi:hypothetical protein
MSEILSTVRVLPLLSPRTIKYVEAMIREGDAFIYFDWLQRVREEEAEAKQAPAANAPRDVVAPRIDNPINTPGSRNVKPSLGPALISKPALNPRALRRPHRQAESQTRKTRLRRWLEKVRVAWDDFQASRRRDAVAGFLQEIFKVVEHYRVRRRTKRLLRSAFEFANLPFDQNADPFSVVIRCTYGGDVDNKTISKWSRALRYASRRKAPDMRLKTFMKEAGGVNACADRYARLQRRS